ncbi:MAG: flavodoxin domain-containing protein [Eubacteriaceae bacterium]|nr:flavodoxin domain-containing protein [Eubacteriaceae bacterium]
MVKASVLYYSKTGKTKQMANYIAQGMSSVEGIEARCIDIEDIDEEFVKESKCVVLGAPTYLADVCAAVHKWLEVDSGKYNLAGKLGGAFATAKFIYGGSELTITSILHRMLVRGMLAYSGGSSYGAPIIHLGPVAIDPQIEESEEVCKIYGARLAGKTLELFG